MNAQQYDIQSRSKPLPVHVAKSADFALGAPRPIEPAQLIAPTWSLYCFDMDMHEAIFVELPEDADLGQATFAYSQQFEQALSVASLPLETFLRIGEQLPLPETVAFLFSTGRCGSTLASRIFGKVPDVYSISEPDCLTNLVFARYKTEQGLMQRLLSAATRFIALAGGGARHMVIKPRSELSFMIEAVARALPDARHVFMYRDAVRYTNSLFRLAQRASRSPEFLEDPEARQLVWYFASADAPESQKAAYLAPGQTEISNLETMVLAWLMRIEAAQHAAKNGVAIMPLHYDDLSTNREAETARLLAACGISPEHTGIGLQGFEQDAHAGGVTANSVPAQDLSEAQIANVKNMLQRLGQRDYAETRLKL